MKVQNKTRIEFHCPVELTKFLNFESFIDYTIGDFQDYVEETQEEYEEVVNEVCTNSHKHFSIVVDNIINELIQVIKDYDIKGLTQLECNDFSVCDYRPSAWFNVNIDFKTFLDSFKAFLDKYSLHDKFQEFIEDRFKSYDGFYSFINNESENYLDLEVLSTYNERPNVDKLDLSGYLEFIIVSQEIEFDIDNIYPN